MPDAAAATPAVAPSTPGIVAAPQPAAPSDDAWISPASLAQPKDDAWIAPTLSGDNLAGSVVGGDLGQGIPPETSVIGTATRGIERAIIPTATGAVGAGMGGEIGVGIGALGGPLAPVTIPIGAVTFSLIGAFAGAMAGGAGQQAAIDALPKAAQDFLGQSKEQQQADIAAHPVIAELAGLAPSFAVLGPGTIAKELPKTAGVFERLLANPVTARIASASLFGAQTAAQEKLEGQPLDPMAIGLSAGAGAFMTKPTALGKQLIGAGALPVKAAADFLRPTTPEAVAAPIIGADNIDDAIAAAKTVADKPITLSHLDLGDVEIEPIDLAAAGAEATQQAAPAPAEGLDAFGGLNPGTIERAADGTYSFRSTDPSGQETVTPMRPGQLALSPTVIDAQRDHYAKLGVDVVYFKDDPAIPFDGAVDPAHPNTIFLSDNPTRNAAQIGAHEVTHILESTTLPDGSNLGDLLHQQVMAGITNEGLDFANRVFGPTAPERATFPTGPEGDSAHADAVVNHLVRELGADIGGEAPKFADFSGRVVDAVQQRYGEQTAKTVLQKLIDGLRAAMDTLRGFFGGGKDATTVSQNFVTNLSEIHDTLAQMYAAKFGTALEKEQAAVQAMRDQADRTRAAEELHQGIPGIEEATENPPQIDIRGKEQAAVQAMMGRAQPAENVSRGTEQAQTARLAPLPAPEAPEAPQTAPAATEFLDAVRGAVEGGGNTRPDVGGPVAGPARAVEDRTLLSPKTERNEPVLSAEYQAALRDHTIAADDYRQALSDYRTRRIGDAEFLAAKARYNEATAAFDAAYAKEQAKEPPLLNAPEASAAEMSARQRQTEREEAELRMRGRQGATAAQEGSGDLPLFGGERQGALFSPKQTETPEFKKWFGNSKIVDENGKPLVVYHGTNEPVEKFDAARLGSATGAKSAAMGFFFSSDPRVAESYAHFAATDAKVAALWRAAEAAEAVGNWDEYDAKVVEMEKLDKDFETPERRLAGQNVMPLYLKMERPLTIDAKGEGIDFILDGLSGAIKKAKRDGNDGVIIRNLDDAIKLQILADHYIVFDPKQVKSAIGNRGTFDETNPDITKSPKVSAATRERLGPAFASMFARAGESGLVPAIDREPANVNRADRRIAGTVRPIEGTGEEKQRAVSPLQTYHVGEEAPQIAAAAKLLADDPERAIAVAMRQKQPPPGVHPEYVFMAVEAKATRDGDTALIAQLSNSRIAEEATAMGQRIGAYKNRDPLSAVAKIDEVQKARLEAVKANVGDVGRAQQAEAQNIKRAVKTAVATRARPSWNDFIASIVCPS